MPRRSNRVDPTPPWARPCQGVTRWLLHSCGCFHITWCAWSSLCRLMFLLRFSFPVFVSLLLFPHRVWDTAEGWEQRAFDESYLQQHQHTQACPPGLSKSYKRLSSKLRWGVKQPGQEFELKTTTTAADCCKILPMLRAHVFRN